MKSGLLESPTPEVIDHIPTLDDPKEKKEISELKTEFPWCSLALAIVLALGIVWACIALSNPFTQIPQ
jgi:hypothetical protein